VFADKKQNSILDATSICKSQLSPPAAWKQHHHNGGCVDEENIIFEL
jgi:hypothetical protein